MFSQQSADSAWPVVPQLQLLYAGAERRLYRRPYDKRRRIRYAAPGGPAVPGCRRQTAEMHDKDCSRLKPEMEEETTGGLPKHYARQLYVGYAAEDWIVE